MLKQIVQKHSILFRQAHPLLSRLRSSQKVEWEEKIELVINNIEMKSCSELSR